jgi:hypothetical protein
MFHFLCRTSLRPAAVHHRTLQAGLREYVSWSLSDIFDSAEYHSNVTDAVRENDLT